MNEENENHKRIKSQNLKIPRPFTPVRSRPPLKVIDWGRKSENPEELLNNECEFGFVMNYASEIFRNLSQSTCNPSINPEYMHSQPDLNFQMRNILVDWIVSVHLKFRLQPETLFLSINLLDRYLSVKEITRNCLQLVGITALMLASKHEEIYPPKSKDFIYVTDNSYSTKQLKLMEVDMLKSLNYSLNDSYSYLFIHRWITLLSISEKGQIFSNFLCELALVEYFMIRFKPHVVSLSAVYLSCKILKEPKDMKKAAITCNITEEELKGCSRELLGLFFNIESHVLTAVKEKYSSDKYLQVSQIKIW